MGDLAAPCEELEQRSALAVKKLATWNQNCLTVNE